jgi:DNA sulfur modification protein DndC
MDGLIETGHDWLLPLREFRNELYATTDPNEKENFRSARRRDGSVTVMLKFDKKGTSVEEKHVLGPYRMEYRKKLLEKLLTIQKQINDSRPGELDLITRRELEQIRSEWRLDPNEPDWADSVPAIYARVMQDETQWEQNDDFIFSGAEAALIEQLCSAHALPKELFMKLIELEVSYEGYARRSNLQSDLSELLARPWGDEQKAIAEAGSRKRRQADIGRDEQLWVDRYEGLAKVVSNAA